MTRLAERKTRLTVITNAMARYRGKDRDVVVEIKADTAVLRLSGTRTRYEVSWRGVFDWAAKVQAERERMARKSRRELRRKGGRV